MSPATSSVSPAPPAPQTISEDGIHVGLTHSPLSLTSTADLIRSPKAGALVLFVGTTRDSFDSKPVQTLSYTSYAPRALQTMLSIARTLKEKHALTAIAITHRLGDCPVGEESIHIAVSAPHRGPVWMAGEECLELVKERVEVWKLEKFTDGAVWRANRDGEPGVQVVQAETEKDA